SEIVSSLVAQFLYNLKDAVLGVQLDLEELAKLQGTVQRERLKRLLTAEKVKIENEIKQLSAAVTPPSGEINQHVKPKTPTTTITSYAWDQSDKFVKIYVTNLKGIQNLSQNNVSLTDGGLHYCLVIRNFNGTNYLFNVPRLANETEAPTFKLKTDMVLIMFKKKTQEKWEFLTEKDKMAKANKENQFKPSLGKEEDPSAGIMGMMKKMYDEGDDEMKRTIAKAWTESRDKQM
uniref:Calcyclin-binding protein n=1 Tax=Ciona savignyi TaxID=51511 RepID=H2ZBN5_CIOSA